MGLDATDSRNMPAAALDWRRIFQALPDGLIVIGIGVARRQSLRLESSSGL
jgi:hypothetical protein